MNITPELFEQQGRPRFGTANPERMRLAFWEWMIRGDEQPPPEDTGILARAGLMMRNGILKSNYGPWRARDLFNAPPSEFEGPIWNFDRMGRTHTTLPDGREVYVAGEHEDYYDPDFHIYNDVVVSDPSGEVAIYGYPRDVFPPTDFHTATHVGSRLILVGCLGYPADRRPGHTPVYALDLERYHIERLDTTGEMPGWIYRHEAELDPDRMAISIRGGEVVQEAAGWRSRENVDEYELDLRTGKWHRATRYNWPQFLIRPSDQKWFGLDGRPDFETFRPGLAHEVLPPADWNRPRLSVEGVTVQFVVNSGSVRIRIEGRLPAGIHERLVEEARRHVEAAARRPCVIDAL